MNAYFAAGLFDSPWVIVAFVVISGIANWLSKRRQEKQAGPPDHPADGEEPSPASRPPPGEFNLEETLRRLMGEEPPPPAPPLLPPALPGPAEEPFPPQWTRKIETAAGKAAARQPANPSVPVIRPPIVMPSVSLATRAASQAVEQAERRFATLSEQARHPATVVTHTRQRHSRSGPRITSRWRDKSSVRRAFVASLVFAPPKSIDP